MAAKKTTKKPAKKSVVKKAVSGVKKAVKKVARSSKPGKVIAKSHPAITMTETIKNRADKPTVTVTGAPSLPASSVDVAGLTDPPRVFGHLGRHVEAIQAAEQENTEVLAELDKHQLSIPEVCAIAWDEVKGSDDPVFADCVSTHQEKLLTHAQAILKGSAPQDGDTIWARFEQAVSRNKEK